MADISDDLKDNSVEFSPRKLRSNSTFDIHSKLPQEEKHIYSVPELHDALFDEGTLHGNHELELSVISMNSSPWQQSYNQQPFLSGGSPLVPPSSHEDTLNNFAGGNANSFLPTSASCQDLQPLANTDPSTLLSNACYESLLSPAVHSSKETGKYYNDDMFNGVCKENQSGMQNFLQCSESRNEGSFPNTNTTNHYAGQVPSISFNSTSNIDQPSPSPFGVLPHLAVKPAVSRSHENFILPVSKTVSAYNNGPYTERENSTVLHNPLSNSSSFSADTATPSPAALNSLSSNFSSPSNDYNTFSPQTMGAYNKPVHSPMPQSPSVAHHSYPSSPYANIDSVGHISAAPPCSPMNGGTYVNNLNAVPVRNGLHKQQLSSSNNSAISNNVCYTPQSHIGPIPGLSKTPDYHPDYNTYAPDRISPSSYSSGYSSMHSSRMSNDSRTSLSPRGNSNIPHEAQIRYGHLRSVPSATVSSPTYLPNNIGHDIQYPPSNMQPPSYMPCPPSISTRSYPGPPSVVSNNVDNEDPYAFPPSEMVDDKGALEMFNCHVELGTHAPIPYSNYLDNDLQILNAGPSNRMLRSSKANDAHPSRSMHYTNANKSLVQSPMLYNNEQPVKTEHQSAMPNYYGSMDLGQMENPMFDTPKRRGGRRGRRRGGNMGCRGRGRRGQSWKNEDRNVYYYDASYSRMNEYNSYQQFKREPDSVPFVSTPGLTARIVHSSDVNNLNNNSTNTSTKKVQRFPYPYGMVEIKKELSGIVVTFHTRRRNLRSCTKRETKYMLDFLLFLKNRFIPRPGTVWPPKRFPKKPEPKKPQPKDKKKQPKERNYNELKIKIKVIDPKKRDKWCCMRGTSESPLTLTSDEEEDKEGNEASTSTVSDHVLLSSHQIKQEIVSEEESSQTTETGNFGQVTRKRSAETKSNFKSVGRGRHLNVTNSETLPAGKAKVKPEYASPAKNPAVKEQSTEAKKLGKKIKSQPSEDTESKTQTGKPTLNGPEATSKSSVLKSDEAHASEDRLGVSRRSNNSTKEPKPGPSTQVDLVDDVSDHFDNYDNFDDSDSDPAWTPSAKSIKAADTAKAFGGSGRKRGAKTGRKSTAKTPAKKRKAASQETSPKKKRQCKPKPTPMVPKATETRTRGRKDTGTDRFLIAKSDINLPTPFIWKVDRKSSMLQRFEISEQNGVLLYHSSFTYAAGNQFCVSNYVTADVKVLSPDTVQYLGPNLSETAEMALSAMRQAETSQENSHTEEENFDFLKEDFTVFIQSLLSQDVDSSFLHEIKKFNDEYFLIPIQNLETISESKKEKLLNEFWNEELKKSINSYPHVNILDSGIDNIKCQACERTLGNKLLQFFGQAYNSVTLEHMDLPPPVAKTQFSVCDNCSISVSLYSRLHHHKYNLFVQCHSKASEVKANNDNVQSHEDVLKLCLEDTVWIEKIFKDQVQIWRDCEKDS